MSAVQAAADRGITELLHYTTSPGILGTLRTGALLSRHRLEGNEEIAFIREPIWPRRKQQWDDHISLSISRINSELYDQSRRNYPEHWWGILSFSPTILDDEDVWFATCNNFFPRCERSQLADGFEALFADSVVGKWDTTHHRADGTPDAWPTDRTAEVLYPGQLGLDHMQRIYVADLKHRAMIVAWSGVFDIAAPEVLVEPDRFT